MSHCIMLIRHAEKPTSGLQGVDECGERDGGSLSVQGWRRAGALVPYFATLAERLQPGVLCRPQYIVAARPSKSHPSTRTADTVQGLADRLGIVVDEQWTNDDPVEDVAAYLQSLDGPVLVCWRHDDLPSLAKAIHAADDMPDAWPADRFDLTWSLRCTHDQWRFAQVPQLLIAGDRLTPIDWPHDGPRERRRAVPEQHVLATQSGRPMGPGKFVAGSASVRR